MRLMLNIRTLWHDENGAVVPIFALVVPILLGGLGLAIDYSLLLSTKTKMQSSLDATILAASARVPASKSAAAEFAKDYLSQAMTSKKVGADLGQSNFELTSDGTGLTGTANATYSTKFARVLGVRTVEIIVKSTAQKSNGARVLDVALCIDATGSMTPLLDAVQNTAMSLHTTLSSALAAKNIQPFDAIRFRPIYFRDFGGNAGTYSVASGGKVDKYPKGYVSRPPGDARNLGDDVPLRAAPDFYDMATQSSDYSAFVSGEVESGGGDDPESGIECINEAMSSDWTRVGKTIKTAGGDMKATSVFSIIALWTDNDAHQPNHQPSLDNPNYPPASRMPRTYSGLKAKWTDEQTIPQVNKLLAFFVSASATDANYQPIKAWDRYMHAGTLTEGTTNLVEKLADSVAKVAGGTGSLRLSCDLVSV
jgi:Flp pilus assembly protein TadG